MRGQPIRCVSGRVRAALVVALASVVLLGGCTSNSTAADPPGTSAGAPTDLPSGPVRPSGDPMAATTPAPTRPISTTTLGTPQSGRSDGNRIIDARPLLSRLTAALNAQDRAGFLLQFEPSVAGVAAQWWDNLAAIGFDAGSVALYGDSPTDVRLSADGSASLPPVMAGVHHPTDGLDDTGAPLIGTTQYSVQIRRAADGMLRISGWQAARPAPWDCTCRLQVVHRGAIVVAATRPQDAAYAAQVADAAVAAQQFHQKLFGVLRSSITPLRGAVIFATDSPVELRGWFSGPDADGSAVDSIAAAFVRDLMVASGDQHSTSWTVGSSRLLVGPMDPSLMLPVLIHELVHYRYFQQRLDRTWIAENPVIPEGIATYVTELWFGSPPDFTASELVAERGNYAAAMTAERFDRLFTGKIPTASDLREGTAQDLEFWYVISASLFAYLAQEFGAAAAFDAASCAYQGRTVFACAATLSGVGEDQLTDGWARWVRAQYRPAG